MVSPQAKSAPWELAARENLFLVAAAPGAVASCAGLIAEACARGRPPMVAVLTDGGGSDEVARAAARGARTCVEAAGMPGERLFLFGLGELPDGGPLFERSVAAVVFLMWQRDCSVVVAVDDAASPTCREVTARTGVEIVDFRGEAHGSRSPCGRGLG